MIRQTPPPFEFGAKRYSHELKKTGYETGSQVTLAARLEATELDAAWTEPTHGFPEDHWIHVSVKDADGEPNLKLSIGRTRDGQDARLRVSNPGSDDVLEFPLGNVVEASDDWHFGRPDPGNPLQKNIPFRGLAGPQVGDSRRRCGKVGIASGSRSNFLSVATGDSQLSITLPGGGRVGFLLGDSAQASASRSVGRNSSRPRSPRRSYRGPDDEKTGSGVFAKLMGVWLRSGRVELVSLGGARASAAFGRWRSKLAELVRERVPERLLAGCEGQPPSRAGSRTSCWSS